MSVTVQCPQCHRSYRVSNSLLGGRVRCQSCGQVFEATPPDAGAAADAAVRPAAEPAPRAGVVKGRCLEVEKIGGVTVVRVLVPRINSENVEEFGTELLTTAEEPAVKKLVLNLDRVEFLFSTALGKIVALEKKLQTHGGSLRVCNLRPVVRSSFDSAGLTLLLRVFPDERQALAGF
jgi:anti-anti-sigma factor